ncbi:hypothetical protein [Rhizobium sp. RAF56]|uniref:hypothetical protein n=1 Tax=Rhizobium sp. RAF56 TaxID=3233062 RepID=UPI003F9B88DC
MPVVKIVASGDPRYPPRQRGSFLSNAGLGRLETFRMGKLTVARAMQLGIAALDRDKNVIASTWAYATDSWKAEAAAWQLGLTAKARIRAGDHARLFAPGTEFALIIREKVSCEFAGLTVEAQYDPRYIDPEHITQRGADGCLHGCQRRRKRCGRSSISRLTSRGTIANSWSICWKQQCLAL